MLLGIDDTDSKKGMCTTFLLTEIIERSGLDVIGLPLLVRLNPTIPFKTRGNAALAVNLGTGIGKSRRIGIFGKRPLYSFESGNESISEKELMTLAESAVMEFSEMEEDETNPGIVVSPHKFPEDLYWNAVRDLVSIEEAENFILSNGGIFKRIKLGRGIIGAAAALAWPERKRTFELLAYRYPRSIPIGRQEKLEMAKSAGTIPGTFNNVDSRNGHASIFPNDITPVILGIRGRDPESLISEAFDLVSSWELEEERVLLYETNQATDDHIISDHQGISDFHSYSLTGRILSTPQVIKGSHYFAEFSCDGQSVKIAAFEPTKEFRSAFRQLRPGDLVNVFGSYQNGVLNVEKMNLMSESRLFQKNPPFCEKCGIRMQSKGHNDYRCGVCGERASLASFSPVTRAPLEGKYDVPVIARRHLSRPYEFSASKEKNSQ